MSEICEFLAFWAGAAGVMAEVKTVVRNSTCVHRESAGNRTHGKMTGTGLSLRNDWAWARCRDIRHDGTVGDR